MIAPWHEQAWAQFVSARGANRLAHGMAITAPGDFFKLDLSRAIGTALLCRSPLANGEACGSCRDCVLLASGTHPDWIVVSPEDSAYIKIDQIRETSARLAQRPQIAARQVVLLFPADRMNTAAANALLKTLEEPTPDSYLILCSERHERLPATIRSRCQAIAVKPLFDERWPAALAARASVSIDAARTALVLAGNDPEVALAIASPEELGARANVAKSLLSLARGQIEPATVMASAGREVGTWLDRFAALLRLSMRDVPLSSPFAEFSDLTSRLEMSRLFALQREQGRVRTLLGSGLREDLMLYELCCQWREAARGIN